MLYALLVYSSTTAVCIPAAICVQYVQYLWSDPLATQLASKELIQLLCHKGICKGDM